MNSIKHTQSVLLIILALMIPVGARTQEYATVKGTITDSTTGEDMPFVRVYLMQNDSMIAQYQTSTDFDGIYIIQYVRFGEYTLVVDPYPLPQKKTNIEISSSGIHIFDFQLSNDSLAVAPLSNTIISYPNAVETTIVDPIGALFPQLTEKVLIIIEQDNVCTIISAPKPVEHEHESWEEYIQNSGFRSYGNPYYGTGSVEVEHKGSLLIVVEPEEPEL